MTEQRNIYDEDVRRVFTERFGYAPRYGRDNAGLGDAVHLEAIVREINEEEGTR